MKTDEIIKALLLVGILVAVVFGIIRLVGMNWSNMQFNDKETLLTGSLMFVCAFLGLFIFYRL